MIAKGDIVSLSRVQVSEIVILTTPAVDGEFYTVQLPINGTLKPFNLTDTLIIDTLDDIATKLAALLLNDQTVYSVAVDPLMPWRLIVVGSLGIAFEVQTSANMTTAIVQTAVLGDPSGKLRVIDSEGTVEKLRRFTTRDRDGNVIERHVVLARELNSSNIHEIDTADILTVLETGT